jgi:hypothetical protein
MTTTQRSEQSETTRAPRGPEQYVTERASKGTRRVRMWTERNTSSGRFTADERREDRPGSDRSGS